MYFHYERIRYGSAKNDVTKVQIISYYVNIFWSYWRCSSTKRTMKSNKLWTWLFQPFCCVVANNLCIFFYIYPSGEFFLNKYLLYPIS